MSGILDSKSRIIDAILTLEGRRQIAEGTFRVNYVTFTDAAVVYVPDSQNGHEDPTSKIYFEAANLPQDQVVFESNDEGKLEPFRSQDVKVKSVGGNVPSAYAEGILRNGRLTIYQYHHGRRVKASLIRQVDADLDKGFVYSDSAGLTGSILVNPRRQAGYVAGSAVGLPNPKAYVGTAGGMGPQEFAQAISGAISALALAGGPSVYTVAINDSVYLDSGESLQGLKIYSTGTLSSPLLIEEAAIGGRILADEVESAAFSSQIQGILTSSFDNFSDLQILPTVNRLLDEDAFVLSSNNLEFDLSRAAPEVLRAYASSPPSLNSVDSLFNDEKLSHLENFMYLPPIVKVSDTLVPDKTDIESLKPYLLGDYPSWGDNEKKLSHGDIMRQVKSYQDAQPSIYFDKSSIPNNVIGQFFEVTEREVRKLDVVDYGEIEKYEVEGTQTKSRVYFIGKTFLDNRGTTCFINMFTLVFSKNERLNNEGIRT